MTRLAVRLATVGLGWIVVPAILWQMALPRCADADPLGAHWRTDRSAIDFRIWSTRSGGQHSVKRIDLYLYANAFGEDEKLVRTLTTVGGRTLQNPKHAHIVLRRQNETMPSPPPLIGPWVPAVSTELTDDGEIPRRSAEAKKLRIRLRKRKWSTAVSSVREGIPGGSRRETRLCPANESPRCP
jgi:hypothetical protein